MFGHHRNSNKLETSITRSKGFGLIVSKPTGPFPSTPKFYNGKSHEGDFGPCLINLPDVEFFVLLYGFLNLVGAKPAGAATLYRVGHLDSLASQLGYHVADEGKYFVRNRLDPAGRLHST
uniref:Putative dna replication licensing factor mcm7 component n=1 Tax=Ixodes ricinus TaxID=34613 RepID=A0A0K8R3Z2_IXORI